MVDHPHQLLTAASFPENSSGYYRRHSGLDELSSQHDRKISLLIRTIVHIGTSVQVASVDLSQFCSRRRNFRVLYIQAGPLQCRRLIKYARSGLRAQVRAESACPRGSRGRLVVWFSKPSWKNGRTNIDYFMNKKKKNLLGPWSISYKQ